MLQHYKFIALSLVLLLSAGVATAQHSETDHHHSTTEANAHAVEHHAEHGKNKVALYLGFTHIPSAYYEHETQEESIGKWVPTLGAEYYRTISPMFDLGLVADVELDSYLVESEDERELSRANVVVLSAVARYKPIPRLGIFAGPGFETEFSSEEEEIETLWVVKFGVDYEVEIAHGWELTPTLSYDLKQHYSSVAFGMSFGKRF